MADEAARVNPSSDEVDLIDEADFRMRRGAWRAKQECIAIVKCRRACYPDGRNWRQKNEKRTEVWKYDILTELAREFKLTRLPPMPNQVQGFRKIRKMVKDDRISIIMRRIARVQTVHLVDGPFRCSGYEIQALNEVVHDLNHHCFFSE